MSGKLLPLRQAGQVTKSYKDNQEREFTGKSKSPKHHPTGLLSQATRTLGSSCIIVDKLDIKVREMFLNDYVQMTQVCSALSLMRKLKSPSAFFLYGIPKNSATRSYNIPLVSICSLLS